VRVESEVGASVPLSYAAAYLHERFGTRSADEYVPGKTRFRDALYVRFGLSQLEAEELCDALERAGLIRFVGPDGDEEPSWLVTEPS
jgi:hypothetical protein